MTGVIRLQISARPAASGITCRLGAGRETPCPKSFRLKAGLHKLRVNAYNGTGRVSSSKLVNLRVTR